MFASNPEVVVERIKARCEELGLKERDVEQRSGHGTWIRNLRRGATKRVNLEKLSAVAAVLETTPEALMTPIASRAESIDRFFAKQATFRAARAEAARPEMAPGLAIAGDLAYAVWAETGADDAPETSTLRPDTRWPAAAQMLYRVTDRSLDHIGPAGTLLLCVDLAAVGHGPREGDLVIVERVERRHEGSRVVERTARLIGWAGTGIAYLPVANDARMAPLLPAEGDLVTVRAIALVVSATVPLLASPLLPRA